MPIWSYAKSETSDRRNVLVARTRRGSRVYATQSRALAVLREGLGEDAGEVVSTLTNVLNQLTAADGVD